MLITAPSWWFHPNLLRLFDYSVTLKGFNENTGSASGLMMRSTGRNPKILGPSPAEKNRMTIGGQSLADRLGGSKLAEDGVFSDADGANYQQELSKLLRCNFSGVSNLYWCENGANWGRSLMLISLLSDTQRKPTRRSLMKAFLSTSKTNITRQTCTMGVWKVIKI